MIIICGQSDHWLVTFMCSPCQAWWFYESFDAFLRIYGHLYPYCSRKVIVFLLYGKILWTCRKLFINTGSHMFFKESIWCYKGIGLSHRTFSMHYYLICWVRYVFFLLNPTHPPICFPFLSCLIASTRLIRFHSWSQAVYIRHRYGQQSSLPI